MCQAESGQLDIGLTRTLPTEVAAQVFESCLPTASERSETPLNRLAPLVLTWVCRAWRNLCLSLPALWTELAIGHVGTDPGDDAQLVDLWMSRSRSLPVCLKLVYEAGDDGLQTVFFDEKRYEKYKASIQQLIRIAVAYIDRWSSFGIHTLDISVLDQIFMAILTRGSPWLKHLSLSTKYLRFFEDVHLLDFSLCPSLRSVCIRTPTVSPVVGSDLMKNMIELDLQYSSSFEECLRWIDICPALVNLTVRLFNSSPDVLADEVGQLPFRDTRRLPRLKYLEVHEFSNEVDIGPFLDVLDAPALMSLTVDMYDMITSSGDWTYVLDLLRRSVPPLETLQLFNTPMTMERIVDCLRTIPSLRKLSIGSRFDTDVLLEALTVIPIPSEEQLPSSKPLCPSLNILDLVNCSWSTGLLASMLSSRSLDGVSQNEQNSRAVTALEELHIDPAHAQYAKENPTIMQCMSRGLNIIETETHQLARSFANPDVVFV